VLALLYKEQRTEGKAWGESRSVPTRNVCAADSRPD
jgi:hypothetical protein